MNEPETIDAIVRGMKTVAVVGLSDQPGRASFRVAQYLQQHGIRIVPVNPTVAVALGERAYASLDEAQKALEVEGGKIDVVDVFRRSEYVPELVKDVIRLKIPALWLQLGVVHEEAAGWAEAAGVKVVMDHCLMVERARRGI